MGSYPCPRCGVAQQAMTLPRDWPAELVAVWRQLERQMVCDDCEGLATPDDA